MKPTKKQRKAKLLKKITKGALKFTGTGNIDRYGEKRTTSLKRKNNKFKVWGWWSPHFALDILDRKFDMTPNFYGKKHVLWIQKVNKAMKG